MALSQSRETPYIKLNLAKIEQNYHNFVQAFPNYKIFYAIKANPHKEILNLLAKAGSYFDTASIGEINMVLGSGVEPHRISYGNTIKKEQHIAQAFAKGVRLFAVDSMPELEKIARSAPGSDIFCRILVDCDGAQWPLSRKFGCSHQLAIEILKKANQLGLKPRGISFHVGSQQVNLACWDKIISECANIFAVMQDHNIKLDLLNLGGGFPIRYLEPVPSTAAIAKYIDVAIKKYFPEQQLELIIEPGRGMVGDCGVICAEVVLIAKKASDDKYRWVYLDVGKFNGLIETLDESIRYKIEVPNRQAPLEEFIIAGPTCDSVDILYEKQPYALPSDLEIGDMIYIHGVGAYSSTYASVCFNGFSPIETYL